MIDQVIVQTRGRKTVKQITSTAKVKVVVWGDDYENAYSALGALEQAYESAKVEVQRIMESRRR